MSEGYVGAPTAKGGNGCAWVVGIVAACGLLLVLGVAALAGFGWSLFSKEAQQEHRTLWYGREKASI